MNQEALLRRKAAIETRFEELSKNKETVDTEMKRLQGEHRLVSELLAETSPVEKNKRLRKVEDNAATDTE